MTRRLGVVAALGGHVAQVAQLLHELLGVLCPAAGHPALAVLEDAAAGVLHGAHHLLVPGVGHEARVGHDPERRRLLDGHQRAHLRARVERDVVVVVDVTVVRDLAVDPQLAQDLEALLEDGEAPVEVQAQRLELAAHALLGVARAGAEDGAAAREDVQRGPLQRQVQRVARRGDEAGRAQLDSRRALRDGRQQGDGLVAGLGEEAVADPQRLEAELLAVLGQVQQLRHAVVGRDQRLPVVEVDPELDGPALSHAHLLRSHPVDVSAQPPPGHVVSC